MCRSSRPAPTPPPAPAPVPTQAISEKIPELDLAIESDNDKDLIELLKQVDHKSTHSSIKAERNVLKVLEGDCETAVGAFANIEGNKINLEVELFSLDGSKRFHLKSSESIDKAEELGIEMGKTLKKMSNNSYKK